MSRQDPVVRPQRELAALLQVARRDILRMSCLQVAEEAGAHNPRAFANRIECFERLLILPTEEEARQLAEVLELDPEEVVATLRDARAAYELRDRQRKTWKWDLELLAAHVRLLLKHREEIARRPAWHYIRVHQAWVSLAYAGGGWLPLGALLDGWSSGELVVDSGGEPSYIYNASGSPLSGSGWTYAFRADSIEDRRVARAVDFASPLFRRAERRPIPTGFSLAQLLSELGQVVPDIDICDGGVLVARYSHSARTLYDAAGSEIQTLDFGATGGAGVDLAPDVAGYMLLGRRVPNLHQGYRGWTFQELALVARHHRLWYTGVLPPAVEFALVDWLGDASDRRQVLAQRWV